MTYNEALNALREGKKVRLPEWNDESYAFFAKPGGLVVMVGGRTCIYNVLPGEIATDKWEIVGS